MSSAEDRVCRDVADPLPRYLIRDRDRSYGDVATRRIRAMGIRDKPIAPASPWQNGFAERLIGSIRRECVDHIVIWSEAHLRRILQAYARYYNDIRTHRSLDKDAPAFRSVQRVGTITRHTQSSADFITITFGFRFWVHTAPACGDSPIYIVRQMKPRDVFPTSCSRRPSSARSCLLSYLGPCRTTRSTNV